MNIPYVATAVDIINHKEMIFDKGSLFHAIRASISIPTVFTPVKKGKLRLVDGGVLNPVPINRVKRVGDDLLVVVNVNAHVPCIKPTSLVKEEKKNWITSMKPMKTI